MLFGVRSEITSAPELAGGAVNVQSLPSRYGSEESAPGSAVRALIDGLPGANCRDQR